MEAKDRLILALDIEKEKAIPLLDQLQGKVGMIKVNSLAAERPEVIQEIKDRGFKVWRDWKHHDIPGTVVNFIQADIKAGVDMCSVHTLGGYAMMRDAAIKAAQENSNIKILGITILTSHTKESFNEELGIPGEIQDKVINLALLAEKAKLDGVVASAKEAATLRKTLKSETLIVTPGITPIWAAKSEDQARVATPKQAIMDGADYIVVGRAIYKAENPGEAADKIVAEIEEGLRELRSRQLALELFDIGAIKFDALADVPTAATPIVSVMSYLSKKPMISPKISKTHGLTGDIDGLFEPGQKVLLIDDLVTTADSKIEAAEVFEKNRLIVKDVLVLVDREQGGQEALLQAGYKLHSVFKITEMLKLYLDEGKIGQEKYDEAVAYLKDN